MWSHSLEVSLNFAFYTQFMWGVLIFWMLLWHSPPRIRVMLSISFASLRPGSWREQVSEMNGASNLWGGTPEDNGASSLLPLSAKCISRQAVCMHNGVAGKPSQWRRLSPHVPWTWRGARRCILPVEIHLLTFPFILMPDDRCCRTHWKYAIWNLPYLLAGFQF